jgi:large subunit ribosomal protein L29
MKVKELSNKKTNELSAMVLSFKKELFNLRFQRAYGQLTKSHRIRYVRRSIAKIKTLLHANDLKGDK